MQAGAGLLWDPRHTRRRADPVKGRGATPRARSASRSTSSALPARDRRTLRRRSAVRDACRRSSRLQHGGGDGLRRARPVTACRSTSCSCCSRRRRSIAYTRATPSTGAPPAENERPLAAGAAPIFRRTGRIARELDDRARERARVLRAARRGPSRRPRRSPAAHRRRDDRRTPALLRLQRDHPEPLAARWHHDDRRSARTAAETRRHMAEEDDAVGCPRAQLEAQRAGSGDLQREPGTSRPRRRERPQQHVESLDLDQPADGEQPRLVAGGGGGSGPASIP